MKPYSADGSSSFSLLENFHIVNFEEGFSQFARGQWVDLILASQDCSDEATTARCRQRRRQSDTIERTQHTEWTWEKCITHADASQTIQNCCPLRLQTWSNQLDCAACVAFPRFTNPRDASMAHPTFWTLAWSASRSFLRTSICVRVATC